MTSFLLIVLATAVLVALGILLAARNPWLIVKANTAYDWFVRVVLKKTPKPVVTVCLLVGFGLLFGTPLTRAADVQLTWTYPGAIADVASFRVDELVGATWIARASTVGQPAPLTLTIPNVTPGVHTYRIVATNEWGDGPASPTAATPAATVAPGRPTIRVTVTTSAAGATTVQIQPIAMLPPVR